MGQWEDKLSAILNDPQTMGRILSIAQSLEGGKGAPPPQSEPASEPVTEPMAEPEPVSAAEAVPEEPVGNSDGDRGGVDLDPRLMEVGMRALSAWQGSDDSRTALLQALRPFVRPERHGKLDKAVRITKLSRVVRAALDTYRGGQGDV